MNAISGAAPKAELVVGLVNNMSIGADDQFSSLVRAASIGRPVRLRRFAVTPTLPGYEPMDALWRAQLDGLIVTGAEPHAAAMQDEPSWPMLARLVDWASEHTTSTIWSCLAAHAAVFRLDGVARRRLPGKLSGVFDCRRAGVHPLLEHAPPDWPVPHSRIYDLDADAIEGAGYSILTRGPGLSDHDGVDIFAKAAGSSMFLMFQGHPEYAADTLLREYRRDLRRWLGGGTRPLPPRGYLDLDDAMAECAAAHLDAVQSARPPLARWSGHGVRLYRNWLAALEAGAEVEAGLSVG